MMKYYWLTTVLGYLLMALAALAFVVYILLLIFVSSYTGAGLLFKAMAGCFIGGILLFKTRSLVVDFLAERILKHGASTTARLLALEHCGQYDMDEKGFADWYQLLVQMPVLPGAETGREAYIEQLFKQSAKQWLKQGEPIPIKYLPDQRLAIVDHEDAYPTLHTGPQFSWRRWS